MTRDQLVERDFRPARADATPELCVSLLTGFEVTCNGETVALPLSTQRLVAFLALRERPLLRVHVATMLWPDSTEERSGANLRSTLWRLRYEGRLLIEATSSRLRLAPTVQVDYRVATARARSLLDPSSLHNVEQLDESAFAGDLLPDWYDDWVIYERERFRQLRLHALESAAERLVAAGRHGQAIQAAMVALSEEPLRESAHRIIARAHLAEGNLGEAILQYRRYRDALRQELEVEPSPLFEELIVGIRKP
jgi:DNA-binding SARP family transcriptional activator